jgi:hypothetical protein
VSATGEAPASAEVSPDLYAEEFVRFFAEGWRAPKPDGFLEHFKPRFVPDVRMIQPLAPTTGDIPGFERLFRGLFDLFPDYEVRVEDWAARGDTVFIWLTHSATIGRRHVSWPGVDRIVLTSEGKLVEREALFDPTEMLPAILRTPRIWPRMVRLLRTS